MHSGPLGQRAAGSLADEDADVFVTPESEIRSYWRYFPAVFKSAKGTHVLAMEAAAPV
jgi:hypothetical protein